eukprot:CAMPEP_0184740698 /NCGR_PEP_ID=MMETSP0315-20130426/3714_1 /TAXON_ID=101924 /ORGANISM="Rhodosorus marinus, Strain UTEX LB 2760" /LENGTH=75 /DNA_ID=CAMNT_0027210531 /DNA_START=34 /DNA_END=258 /DNA_ORIENTATION=-
MVDPVTAVAIAGSLFIAVALAVTAIITFEAHKHSWYGEDPGNQDERSVSRRQRLRAVVVLDRKTNDAIATTLEDV